MHTKTPRAALGQEATCSTGASSMQRGQRGRKPKRRRDKRRAACNAGTKPKRRQDKRRASRKVTPKAHSKKPEATATNGTPEKLCHFAMLCGTLLQQLHKGSS